MDLLPALPSDLETITEEEFTSCSGSLGSKSPSTHSLQSPVPAPDCDAGDDIVNDDSALAEEQIGEALQQLNTSVLKMQQLTQSKGGLADGEEGVSEGEGQKGSLKRLSSSSEVCVCVCVCVYMCVHVHCVYAHMCVYSTAHVQVYNLSWAAHKRLRACASGT